MTTTAARSCPACGAELPRRPAGRPATYCSMGCRQSAYRARRSADRAAEAAAAHLGELLAARGELDAAIERMRAAYASVPAAEVAEAAPSPAPTQDWQHIVWSAARHLIRVAATISGAAEAHDRAAGEFAAAGRRLADPGAAGVRSPAGSSPARYETSVVAAAAEASTTEPGAAAGGVDDPVVVDRDAVFDVVEDAVYELDDTRAHLLPTEIYQALADPARRLAAAFEDQSGDGPLADLLSAAHHLAAAALPYLAHPDIPERLADALTGLGELPAAAAAD